MLEVCGHQQSVLSLCTHRQTKRRNCRASLRHHGCTRRRTVVSESCKFVPKVRKPRSSQAGNRTATRAYSKQPPRQTGYARIGTPMKVTVWPICLMLCIQPSSAADPAWVGSKTCAKCHAEIYRKYNATPMAISSGPANSAAVPSQSFSANAGFQAAAVLCQAWAFSTSACN